MIKTMKSTGEVTNKIETLQSCEVGATGIIKNWSEMLHDI